MSPRAALAAAALAVLLAGCGGSPPDVEPTEPSGLSGVVMQYRSDIAARVLTVRIRTEHDVRITGVVLRPAGFDSTTGGAQDLALRAGTTVDLRIEYGPARCADDDPGSSIALLTVVRDGETRDVEVELADEYDAIAGIRRAECAERAVRDRVSISFGDAWTRDGSLLRGTLLLRRLDGTDPIVITEFGGTTLFGLRPAAPGPAPAPGPGPGPVTLDAGQSEVTAAVEVETTRCDPHALAESKRATAFVVYVAVGAGDPVRLTVEPSDREPFLAFATDSCASRL